MELREVAEQVLFGKTLEEKLLLSPSDVTDESPLGAFTMPSGPGRPKELELRDDGVRADFPGTNRLDEDEERGKMLHFLANHELLATELMALVLLKFPNAPKEFRMGVYETLKEEQAHTLMYMRRMKECGVHFGDLPVNAYFWRVVAPMEEPIDFVTRLSLVFEQANLDYSVHYAKLFRQVGDTGTAAVLDKIYKDEIEHVGHGLKWFRRWKDQGQTDWQAFCKQLVFPLSATKAKGVAPFNPEGRLAAGLDNDFIDHLEIAEKSRGRTPVVHWFNPNAEGAAAAHLRGARFQPKKHSLALEVDLDLLPVAWARQDDVVLVKQMPTKGHLRYLRRAGFEMPEVVACGDDGELLTRKLGGFNAWAWSPDAMAVLQPYAGSELAFEKVKDAGALLSKRSGVELGARLGVEDSYWVEDLGEVDDVVNKLSAGGDVLLKAPFSSAGRGHRKLLAGQWGHSERGWLKRLLAEQGGVVIEPWLDRVLDFSAQYHVAADGSVKFLGMTRVVNDEHGRFHGCFVHQKWAVGLDKDVVVYLFRDQEVMKLYREDVLKMLEGYLRGKRFEGALGVDAMVHRKADGSYALKKVVEVNARTTMGRVSLELMRKTAAGHVGYYQIVRKSQMALPVEEWLKLIQPNTPKKTKGKGLKAGSYALNDPMTAQEFVAVWHVRDTVQELEPLMG